MRPRLVEFFVNQIGTGFFVPDYAFALSVAIIVGLYLTMKQAEKARLKPQQVFRACVITIGVALVSARLYVVFQHLDYYRQQPVEIFQIWKGGLASYGAYFGGGMSAIVVAKWQRLSVAKFLDACAPAVALSISIGRIGCFLNGCCHGKLSNLPWAMRFPEDSGPYYNHLHQGLIATHQLSLPVHPTQLYESLYALVVFLVLFGYRKNQKRDGELFALLFVLYPLGRFFLEFLRDDERGNISFLSWPQAFSIIAATLSISFLLARRQKLGWADEPTTAIP